MTNNFISRRSLADEVAVASNNEILADLYKTFSIQIKNRFLSIHKDTTDFRETQNLHEQLLKSIEANDTKKTWNTAAKIIGHKAQ